MPSKEKRTQLYLSKEQFNKMNKLAKLKRTSFAHLTREAIDAYLRHNEAKWDDDSISKHIGIFEGKERDLSVNHDHYIYDDRP